MHKSHAMMVRTTEVATSVIFKDPSTGSSTKVPKTQ